MLKIYLLAAFVGAALAKNTYVFVAPNTVRPGMEFEVSGNILKAASDVNVAVTLMKGAQSIASTNGVLQEGHPRGLTISVPKNIHSGSYTLNITGSGGLTISETKTLSFQSKSMSIFVQTDKAMYKPGQTIHFRAFAIYPDMKMFTGTMNIEIFDPNSNKIKQWIGVQYNTGVITNYLPMTSQPVKGDWKIKVTAGSVSTEKVFTIAEYVLPKFEVTVELPSYALSSDQDITATVKAKYTYGKPVKGNVNLVAKLDNYYSPWNYKGVEPMVQETKTIDGETKIVIPLAEMRRVFNNNLNNRKIQVIANVTEGLTGITLNGSSKVQLYQYATKLTFAPTDPKTFKPGLKYIAYLQVQQQDSRPVPMSSQQVVVSTRVTVPVPTDPAKPTPVYYYPRTTSFTQPDGSFSVPDTGVVPIELHIPANASSISLTVKYGTITAYKTVEKSYSPSSNYIQLLLNSQRLSAGDNVRFDVKATEAVSEYVYQIMSRGSIVATGIKNANGQSTFNLAIPLTSKMAPNARIILYYVRTDGEIVTDSISFDVEGVFENKVSITMDKTSAQPGDSVNVKVTADPQSLVNLLAVDQSVLLLKSGNDITQGQVIDEIKTYDTIKNTGRIFGGGMRPMFRRKRMAIPWGWGYPIYYGGSDATQIFQNAGVIVLTDALVYKYVKPYLPPIFFGPLPGGVNHILKGTGGHVLKEVENVRDNFPEMWMWTNKTAG